jgi:hypothetical protein
VLAGAHRHDSPLLATTLDQLGDLGPLPDDSTMHLDAGYDSGNTRDTLAASPSWSLVVVSGQQASQWAEVDVEVLGP